MNKVLIVEDSLVERTAIALILNRAGFKVQTIDNGEEVQAKIASCRPDVIILDVILPGRSGFEICRYLKANPEMSKIPIIFCSSKTTELDKFWGLRQGAAAYLTKPLADNELLQTIGQLVPA
ncbi:two-component system response regulator [Pleurocapsa sp. CCALA 161]|uniref:response regulator transcription factor n=1 Tax=Pleurocapsa sp. CCALA 161 TaxID=2107688 RepID=UPI000D058300|nr:response regulator [Pleurocapsa sp. CCALA 161]PSB07692.1 two-component system response regulator [Pleurocapsa sp. CCALA 161]